MVPSMPITGRTAAYTFLILTIACTGCASYRFGNSTLYATNVRTVYVPVVQSESFRTVPAVDIGERLTEAICKEIKHGPRSRSSRLLRQTAC